MSATGPEEALEHFRAEVLRAMRSDEVKQRIAEIIANSHDTTALQIASEIVDYLTLPQIQIVSPDSTEPGRA
jgi:hypothetical protein